MIWRGSVSGELLLLSMIVRFEGVRGRWKGRNTFLFGISEGVGEFTKEICRSCVSSLHCMRNRYL